ncbi:MAG: DUF1273 family protein [Christensenellaceae bacterium]|nr:DUF1273 family protein [Christensenellaceae bacterium]
MYQEISCCFTGHRPPKLSWRYDENNEKCVRLKLILKEQISKLREKGVRLFLTGMADGVDIYAAEAVIELKKEHPEWKIKLIGIIPYTGQEGHPGTKYYSRYQNILQNADRFFILSPHYTQDCLLERNRFMVDQCKYVLAVYNGEKGGTGYTINYAKQKNRDITIIDPETIEISHQHR